MLFGSHSPPGPYEGLATVLELERTIGRRVDIVHLFQAWGSADTAPFRVDWVTPVVRSGRRVLLTWEPWVPGAGPRQPEYALRAILGGRHDRYAAEWAALLATSGLEVYLRPMHEMNGNWYPWGGGVDGNSSADYAAAWRHLHRIFERAGATNVRWVWAPNTPDVPADNRFEPYYPGDDHVDVLGLDGYNWGAGLPEYGGWRWFAEIFAGDYDRLIRLGPQPVWITETATCADGGDKAAWVCDMFESLPDMPRIEAVVWFDVLKERDWRLTGAAGISAAFAQAGSSSA